MSAKVCLCKHVLEDTVAKAIHEGACKEARCRHKIHERVPKSK